MNNKIWTHIGAGDVRFLSPETQEGVRTAAKFFSKFYVQDLYITHMQAGIHSIGSFHPFGRAFDIRYPLCTAKETKKFKKEFKKAMGDNFDVVYHLTHIHVEYHPKVR